MVRAFLRVNRTCWRYTRRDIPTWWIFALFARFFYPSVPLFSRTTRAHLSLRKTPSSHMLTMCSILFCQFLALFLHFSQLWMPFHFLLEKALVVCWFGDRDRDSWGSFPFCSIALGLALSGGQDMAWFETVWQCAWAVHSCLGMELTIPSCCLCLCLASPCAPMTSPRLPPTAAFFHACHHFVTFPTLPFSFHFSFLPPDKTLLSIHFIFFILRWMEDMNAVWFAACGFSHPYDISSFLFSSLTRRGDVRHARSQ